MLSEKETIEIFSKYGITLNHDMYERLNKYSHMLTERNNSVNLTAITDDEGVTIKHFFDSIYPFTMFEMPQSCTLIDVGTGAGFPSCPLKIYRDDIKITLLDSLNKRVKFLNDISDELSLGAECIHGRAEEYGKRAEYREKFDIACARAVSNLTALSEYCLPFVKKGGYFAALKGSGGREELKDAEKAIKILGGKVEAVKEYSLPNGDARTLILIKKLSASPSKYPRNAAKMKSHPLSL